VTLPRPVIQIHGLLFPPVHFRGELGTQGVREFRGVAPVGNAVDKIDIPNTVEVGVIAVRLRAPVKERTGRQLPPRSLLVAAWRG
jgi:hypothetical protein